MSKTNNKQIQFDDSGSNLMSIQMSNYVAPVITENQRDEWVDYGDDNDYFNYLLDRYYGSTTNHAIINGLADMIGGEGVTSPLASERPSEYAMAKTLFKTDDVHKWAFDLKCLGFYIMIVTVNNENTIIQCEHTPVQNWRSGITDDEGDINEWFYSDNWAECTKPEFKPIPYPVFNEENPETISVIVTKPYRAGSFYYPFVDYMGALQYAQLEEEIANFHVNNIMNGLSPSAVINFNNGVPDVEERRKIKNEVRAAMQGSANSGRWWLAFNDDKDRAVTFEIMPVTDADKQYQFLSEEAVKKIMIGHRITSPLFFGIRDSSGLGSNANEIEQAWELFSRMVLRPYQILLVSSFEMVLRYNDVNLPLSIKTLKPIESTTSNQTMSKKHDIPKSGFQKKLDLAAKKRNGNAKTKVTNVPNLDERVTSNGNVSK